MINYHSECYIEVDGIHGGSPEYWTGKGWSVNKSDSLIVNEYQAKELMDVLLKKYTWIFQFKIGLYSDKTEVFTIIQDYAEMLGEKNKNPFVSAVPL